MKEFEQHCTMMNKRLGLNSKTGKFGVRTGYGKIGLSFYPKAGGETDITALTTKSELFTLMEGVVLGMKYMDEKPYWKKR
jgi:hypothetical protein